MTYKFTSKRGGMTITKEISNLTEVYKDTWIEIPTAFSSFAIEEKLKVIEALKEYALQLEVDITLLLKR